MFSGNFIINKKHLLSKETTNPLAEEKPCGASVNVMLSNPR